MRRAFVGLSTPVGFDYQNPASKAPADGHSSPNPILESPFGLLLLFDEIVFLTRSLCPENMRQLPYVRFLDEIGKAPLLTIAQRDASWDAARALSSKRAPTASGGEESFEASILRAGASWQMGIDNHSHGLSLGEAQPQANASVENFYLDMFYCQNAGLQGLELVTNTRLQSALEAATDPASEAWLAQAIVLKDIPNYLGRRGPYHPAIEEVRENAHLTHFRTWMSERSSKLSLAEIGEARDQVEAVLRDAQENLFLKHLDPDTYFKSLGKAVVGDLVGLAFPLTGTVTAAFEGALKIRSDADMRWQGFIVGARRSLRGI